LYDGINHSGPDLVDSLYRSAVTNNFFLPGAGQVTAVVLDPSDGANNTQSVIIEVKGPTVIPPCSVAPSGN
ncbi:MAG: hypothetical protein ACREP9_19585, partial [Candidatus Dormibacteraceae bacterium]